MDKVSISDIKRIILKHYKLGDFTEWKNKNFENLSFDIHQKTKILISSSTLKRIFGKRKTNDSYQPQQTTLDALIQFIETLDEYSVIETPKSKKVKYSYIFLGIIIVAVISIYFLFFNKTAVRTNYSANLELVRIEGKNTSSAFFKMNLPEIDNQKLSIYFGDYSDTLNLNSSQKSISHYYKYPGIFHPVILLDGIRISNKINVVVNTDGWRSLGTHHVMAENDTIYPIDLDNILKPGGYLHASTQDYAKSGVDTTELVLLRLYNYQDFGVGGDHFDFKARMRNTQYWPGVQCNNIIVQLKGENGRIQMYYPKQGCSYWIEAFFSEIHRRGTASDLSSFCHDLSDWTNIQILNQNKKLNFFIADSLVYEVEYQKPLGKIIGIEFHFFGSGYLDEVSLESTNSNIQFFDSFD